ncbi:MAG: gliding motility-associated C-terminal domain-containing protein [Bacteroidota bacterium]
MKLFVTFILVLTLSCSIKSSAQQLFHQDIFHGGVTAAGFSTGIGAATTYSDDTITVNIEPGSTIRNAWMFVYSMGYPDELSIVLDGDLVEIDTVNSFLSSFSYPNSYATPIKLYAVDIRDIIEPNQTEYPIEILNIDEPINWGWWSPVLYIEYNNSNLDKITTSLWYNDLDMIGLEEYNFNGLNNIDFSQNIGLSLFTDRAGDSNPYDIFINNTQIGEFNQNDNYNTSTNAVGVQGHFYYQNSALFGLGDDVPNTTMYGSDGIAVINNYLSNGDTGYELKMEHHQNPAPPLRKTVNLIFPHAYTTPCDTFSTQITADTSICRGDSLQLFASGGNNYEWLNIEGMDNPNISNPKVSPDSTQLYVVRIENTPGCYRTEQVLVELNENPTIDSLKITPEICGDENGEVKVWKQGQAPFTLTLDSTSQSSGTFSNLTGGTYDLEIVDDNQCSLDTTIVVPIEIAIDAGFTANPESGYEPLSVQLTNTSQNATNYEWFVDDAFWENTTHTSAYFDTTGVYDITLYAYNNRPECVDSAAFKIVVKDTIYARIPNIITPNGDAVNDTFTIDVKRAKQIEAHFLNRWGNEINSAVKQSNGLNETIPLWNGKTKQNEKVTEGTYFYTITITSVADKEYEFHGHVQVSY